MYYDTRPQLGYELAVMNGRLVIYSANDHHSCQNRLDFSLRSTFKLCFALPCILTLYSYLGFVLHILHSLFSTC